MGSWEGKVWTVHLGTRGSRSLRTLAKPWRLARQGCSNLLCVHHVIVCSPVLDDLLHDNNEVTLPQSQAVLNPCWGPLPCNFHKVHTYWNPYRFLLPTPIDCPLELTSVPVHSIVYPSYTSSLRAING